MTPVAALALLVERAHRAGDIHLVAAAAPLLAHAAAAEGVPHLARRASLTGAQALDALIVRVGTASLYAVALAGDRVLYGSTDVTPALAPGHSLYLVGELARRPTAADRCVVCGGAEEPDDEDDSGSLLRLYRVQPLSTRRAVAHWRCCSRLQLALELDRVVDMAPTGGPRVGAGRPIQSPTGERRAKVGWRITPSAAARVAEEAARQGVSASALVEAWALGLAYSPSGTPISS